MSWIDWFFMIVPAVAVIWIGFRVRQYLSGVSDFLAGGRCAGRYLICVADGSAGLGLITVIGSCEMNYHAGFALSFWSQFAILFGLAMTLTGFVTYRYRQTRAMTMAQFFEMRYSRKFRVFAGFLAFLSGLFNYALFPAVGGRFLMYYCALPEYLHCGPLAISTFGFLMFLSLGVALVIVVLGGQLTTMVTDCVQGIYSYFVYAIVVAVIFTFFSLSDIETAVLSRPEGMSYFNPFNIGKLSGFNILYVLISLFSMVYCRNAWLGNQGYMCAAVSPHEQKMAGLLGTWRNGFLTIMLMLLVIGVYTYMNHPKFASESASVTQELVSRIHYDTQSTTETIRKQMMVPIALRHILPAGAVGLFCSLMLFLMVSTDTTYLHSWGTILAQDIILPIRGKPISPKAHILLLRSSILFIAVFAWTFSFFFGQVDFIYMFFAMTGTVFLGGAGSAIIGGLYSRRGTTQGAFAAMSVGCFFGVGGFLLINSWETHIFPFLQSHAPDALEQFRLVLYSVGERLPIVNWETDPAVFARKFPISAQEIFGVTMILALVAYIAVSMLTFKKPFNLDKLLHRGEYASEEELRIEAAASALDNPAGPMKQRAKPAARRLLDLLLGISPEYSRGDRILAWSVFLWSMLGLVIFLFQLTANLGFGVWSERTWFRWWSCYTLPLNLLYGLVTSIWFTWGGIRDIARLFKMLRQVRRDASDNGQN